MSDQNDTTGLSAIDIKRREVEALREASRRKAEAMAEARELAALGEERAYEEARQKLYDDPNHGPERTIGGYIHGGGHVLATWPDDITWRHFVNRGVLKKDGLTQELCDELACRCVKYPTLDKFREMMRRNPTASMQVTNAIIECMQPEDAGLGKGQTSSPMRR